MILAEAAKGLCIRSSGDTKCEWPLTHFATARCCYRQGSQQDYRPSHVQPSNIVADPHRLADRRYGAEAPHVQIRKPLVKYLLAGRHTALIVSQALSSRVNVARRGRRPRGGPWRGDNSYPHRARTVHQKQISTP
jgi:hypothetical protein